MPVLKRFLNKYERIGKAAVVLLLMWGAPLCAQPLPAENGDKVTLNFVDADIEAVVRTVSEITGRNFIIDPKVKGTVNIISTRPVARDLVYPTLLSALRMQGITAIEGDDIVRIVVEADAKLYNNKAKTGDGRLITKVIPLRYEAAAPMVGILRPLISSNNTVSAFTGSNALVITDYADNIERVEKIIASLDQPPADEPLVVPLKNASAYDMVPMLDKLLADSGSTGSSAAGASMSNKVTLVADGRSNSILVRSENPGRMERVRALIERLDNQGRPGGNFFIVYLKNGDANAIAQTLQGLLTGNNARAGQGSSPQITQPASGLNGLNSGVSSLLANATAETSALPFAPTQQGYNTGFSVNGMTVQADEATNSLVIMAPEPVYNTIRGVIEKLDVPRAQVFIEALIVEMEADKAAEFGIQWQVLGDKHFFGGTNYGSGGQNILDVAAGLGTRYSSGNAPISSMVNPGLNIGILDGAVTLGGREILNLGFMARALEVQAKANILSTPTLLTLDNQEASIMVGQNIPVMTGQYSSSISTSSVEPFQTYDRQDVGLMLRIKPQITENGMVRMSIYQEVSRVLDLASVSGPVLSKRSLDSAVSVDDSQIIVLGGLIEDRMTDGADKVPLLGDIPVLGNLFRYDSRNRQKTNLLIFLKPTIVRTAADAREYTTERYRYLMGEQKNLAPQSRFFWNDPTIPELLPQGVLPGSEIPLPEVSRGEPMPSGAMLIPMTPFVPEKNWP